MKEPVRKRVSGGCHCGAVRFTIATDPAPRLLDCNCSICSRMGFLHLIVAHEDFTLESGEAALVSYRFGTGQAEHLFCGTCGIKSFYRPRSHPDGWSVNYRCLDPGHGLEPSVEAFDGRNWDSARSQLED